MYAVYIKGNRTTFHIVSLFISYEINCKGGYLPKPSTRLFMFAEFISHVTLDEEKNGYVARDQLLYAL